MPNPRCPQCGLEGNLCGYHVSFVPEGWAVLNRIVCDYVHRGVPFPVRSCAMVDRCAPCCRCGEPTYADGAAWSGPTCPRCAVRVAAGLEVPPVQFEPQPQDYEG